MDPSEDFPANPALKAWNRLGMYCVKNSLALSGTSVMASLLRRAGIVDRSRPQ
jgi:hypothetical protein